MLSHPKKHTYKLSEIGDKVYVRCKKEKDNKKLTKHMIDVILIIKRCRDDTNCNLRIEVPGHQLIKKWDLKIWMIVHVKNIQYLTHYLRSGYEASLSKDTNFYMTNQQIDGNCQFPEVAYALTYKYLDQLLHSATRLSTTLLVTIFHQMDFPWKCFLGYSGANT